MDFVFFLPCRRGSERVKGKNTRPFAGIQGGLAWIKLSQLCQCGSAAKIVVSTDDRDVAEIAASFRSHTKIPIEILDRPAALASSSTSTDDLIRHVPEIIGAGIVMWTHVTSPFVGADRYQQAIKIFSEQTARGRADSLMSVCELQTFLWSASGPLNYDRDKEKWPRTQTLTPLYEVNSAIFMAPVQTYRTEADRIGQTPYLFKLSKLESLDIDTEEDYRLAEALWKSRNAGVYQ